MPYTFQELAVFLLLAGAAGFLVARALEARARRAADATLARELADLRHRAEAAALHLAARDADLAAARAAAADAVARARLLETRAAETEGARATLCEEVRALRARCAQLEAAARPARAGEAPRRSGISYPAGDESAPPASSVVAGAPAGESAPPAPDDLQRIRGIGPATARRLGELGYRTFADVAAWDAAAKLRVAREIGATVRRIETGRWVEQARALAGVTPPLRLVPRRGADASAAES